MPTSIDPLELLKDFYQKPDIAKYDESNRMLIFSHKYYIPISAKTAWVKLNTEKQYTIGTLWYCIRCKDDSIKQYMMKADQDNFEKYKF